MRFDSFSHLLSHQALALGDRIALRGAGVEYTYRQLCDRALALAEDWRRAGKTCLGVLCDGTPECVLAILSANLAGLQVVLLDEHTPESLLPRLIEYTDVDVLWGDEDLVQDLAPYLTAGVQNGAGRLLFFTSGTTRAAKAVVLTDRSLCASAYNGGAKLPLSTDDTLLCMLPLNHVFGFVCGLLWALSCGAAVAMGRGMRHYGDDCGFFKPTVLSAVPSLLGFLLRAGAINPELRLILVGAGDCPPQLLRSAEELGLQISFGYGLTETSSGVALSVSGNPYAMEICPDDTVTLAEDGEILIHAPTCIMQGYYKLPEETDQVLQNGILHTGDLGFLDEEGRLHLQGRKKEILVLQDGTKLYLPEYESALAQLLQTRELAVVLRQQIPTLVLQGQGEEQELLRRLAPVNADRPRNQQIKKVIFLSQSLPRTATGKLKRWELNQIIEETML